MFKNKDLSVIFILWIAMMFSVVMYGILAFSMTKNPNFYTEKFDQKAYHTMLNIMPLIAVFFGGLSVFLRRALLKESFYSKLLSNNTPRSVYMITIITSSAFAEVVAILGLVLFFIGKNTNIFLPFALISIVIMIYNKPSVKEYEKLKKDF